MVGFIEVDDAPRVEKQLHDKLKPFRLNGEWFDITTDHALNLISMYSNKDYIDSKNSFEIKYANRNKIQEVDDIKYNFSFEKSDVYNKVFYINQTELSEITGISKENLRKIFKENKAKGMSKKTNGIVRTVYKIFFKNDFDL